MPPELTISRPVDFDIFADLIERVAFHNGKTGFAVRQVKVRGQADRVLVLGTLPELTAGEWLDAQGRGVIDQEYGRQFRFRPASYRAAGHPNL